MMQRFFRGTDNTQAASLRRLLSLALRWMLVLVLAFDQVGSPLHAHAHDSGIDGRFLIHASVEGLQAGPHLEDPHAQDDEHGVIAMRTELRSSLPCFLDPSGLSSEAFLVEVQRLRDEEGMHLRWSSFADVVHSAHKDLPPAGRAPPFRA